MIPLNLATKYIFFTLCWLIKLCVKIVVIECKAPINGSKTASSNVAFYSFSTCLCEIKGNKQTINLRLYVSWNTEKIGKMKEIKNVSPNLGKRLHGEYKDSKLGIIQMFLKGWIFAHFSLYGL